MKSTLQKLLTCTVLIFWGTENFAQLSFEPNEIFFGSLKSIVSYNGFDQDSAVFSETGKLIEVWRYQDGYNNGEEEVSEIFENWHLVHTYSYDDNNNMIASRLFYNKKPIHYFLYTYNDVNALIEEQYYLHTKEGEYVEIAHLYSKIIYDYDENGYLLKKSTFNTNGNLVYEDLFKYNEKGFCSEYYDARYQQTTNYVYDENDYVLEEKVTGLNFNGENETYSLTRKYNAQGELIEINRLNKKGKITNTHTAEYGANGKVFSWTSKSKKDVSRSEYIYEFDELGNWTKYTNTLNGETNMVVERYYFYN